MLNFVTLGGCRCRTSVRSLQHTSKTFVSFVFHTARNRASRAAKEATREFCDIGRLVRRAWHLAKRHDFSQGLEISIHVNMHDCAPNLWHCAVGASARVCGPRNPEAMRFHTVLRQQMVALFMWRKRQRTHFVTSGAWSGLLGFP